MKKPIIRLAAIALLLFSINPIIAQTNGISSLIGTEYADLGKEIKLDDGTILYSGGGYILLKDNKIKNDFAIHFSHSETSFFYLLIEFRETTGKKRKIITDVLEMKKTEIKPNQKITEYCETRTGPDREIFALVKNEGDVEFYTHIIKAWRANRKTGKFEKVKRRKVKKCGNESYGI